MNFWKYAKIYRPRQIWTKRKINKALAGKQEWEWFNRTANRLRENPTPLEIKMELILDSLNINHKRQYVFIPYIVDFYLPSYNAVIECDGPRHEKHVARKKDLRRDKMLIKMQHVKILHVRNHEFFSADRLKQIVFEFVTGLQQAITDRASKNEERPHGSQIVTLANSESAARPVSEISKPQISS